MKKIILVLIILFTSCTNNTLEYEDNASYYTLAWISDTQNLVDHNEEAFKSMMIYLQNNQVKEDIRYLIHTGDVINIYSIESQWKVAREAFDIIDDKIAYSVIAGNHDLLNDNELFIKYFNKEDKMSFDHGLAKADIVDGDKLQYLIISLSYDPSDEMIDWANNIIEKHLDKIVIINTHSYLNVDGNLNDIGQNIYNNIVKAHDNVKLVLCGHIHGVYNGMDIDSKVINLLCDYQEDDNAYIRMLRINEEEKVLSVISYDPYHNVYDETNNRSFDISSWFK